MAAPTIPAATVAPMPYRGLAPYREEDVGLFFGRTGEIGVIANNLLASRLTLLYGPSGVGKSSILAAGVVPRLRALAGGELDDDDDVPRPVVVRFDDWSADVATALIEQVADAAGVEPLPAAGLTEALVDITRRARVEVLLVLDGFEDYLARSRPGEGPLDTELPRLLARRGLPVRALIAVREDALAALDRFLDGMTGVFDNPLRLDRLSAQAAREAIEGPIQRYADLAREPVELEPGLAGEVVRQLAGAEAGGAGRVEPVLLQLVMSRLWARETQAGSRVLRRTTLDELGDVRAIVRSHVDAALGALAPRQQEIAARAFHLLVTPSGTRVRHTTDDLAAYSGEPEPDVRALLERLSRSDTRIVRPVPPPPGVEGARPRAAFELFHELLADAVLDWRERWQAARTLRLERRTRRLLSALVAVTAASLGLIVWLWNPGLVRKLELGTIDQRFAVRGTQTPERDVVMVVNDAASARALGGTGGIVPRGVHARVLDRVDAGRPRVIAYDVFFEGEKPSGDQQLVDAVRRARSRLVLGVQNLASEGGELFPLLFPALEDVPGLKTGYVTVPADPDDVVRRIDSTVALSEGGSFPTLAFGAAQVAGGASPPSRRLAGARGRATAGQSENDAWIDYAGEQGSIPRVSFTDVVRGRVPARFFRRKLVVVGNTDPVLGDRLRTSAGGGSTMDGMEAQANALATIDAGMPLRDVPALVDALLILLLAAVPLAALRLRSRVARAAVVVGAAIVLLVAVQLLFQAGWIAALVVPLGVLVVATAGALLAGAITARRRHAAGAA